MRDEVKKNRGNLEEEGRKPTPEEVAEAKAYLAGLTPEQREHLRRIEGLEEVEATESFNKARPFRGRPSLKAAEFKQRAHWLAAGQHERAGNDDRSVVLRAQWAKEHLWLIRWNDTPEEKAARAEKWREIEKVVLVEHRQLKTRSARNVRHRSTRSPERAALDRAKNNLRKAEVRLAQARERLAEMEREAISGDLITQSRSVVHLPDVRAKLPATEATVERWRRAAEEAEAALMARQSAE